MFEPATNGSLVPRQCLWRCRDMVEKGLGSKPAFTVKISISVAVEFELTHQLARADKLVELSCNSRVERV
jgi:hypothetical protein